MIKAIIYEDESMEKRDAIGQELDYSDAIQRLKARLIDSENFMQDENPWKVDYKKFSQRAYMVQDADKADTPPLDTKSRCKERAIKSFLEAVLFLERGNSKTALETVKEGLMYLCIAERKPL